MGALHFLLALFDLLLDLLDSFLAEKCELALTRKLNAVFDERFIGGTEE
jgi:hypothetical protein